MRKTIEQMNFQELRINCGYKSARTFSDALAEQTEDSQKKRITKYAVAAWELGISMPRTEDLPDVSKVLGVSIDKIISALQTSKKQRQAQ